MVVVSDSSPLILLSRLGLLDLLPALLGRVIVPGAVYREVVHVGDDLPGSRELRAATWTETVEHDPEDPLLRGLSVQLGPGERSALSVALARGADLLLMDERLGRLAAVRLGLAVKGTVGLLVLARQRNLIPSLRNRLEELEHAGARLSPPLLEAALRVVGETG